MRDSYCIENDFAAQKELAEKDSANIDEQWKDRLEFNALRLRAERSEAKLSLWQKDMNEVLRQRDDLHARVARLEEALKLMIDAHGNTNVMPTEQARRENEIAKMARRALEEK